MEQEISEFFCFFLVAFIYSLMCLQVELPMKLFENTFRIFTSDNIWLCLCFCVRAVALYMASLRTDPILSGLCCLCSSTRSGHVVCDALLSC